MWNKQETTEPQSQPSPEADNGNGRITVPSALSSARIGAGLKIKGSVTGEEDLQIDGKVEGPVTIQGRLTVGCSGQLTSGVTARELAVYGKISGNVDARDRVEIKRDGAVIGDIQTARISIEDGAIFKGRIEIGRS
jgi:cytoskeletal protein CcmA (bactofilin family)